MSAYLSDGYRLTQLFRRRQSYAPYDPGASDESPPELQPGDLAPTDQCPTCTVCEEPKIPWLWLALAAGAGYILGRDKDRR